MPFPGPQIAVQCLRGLAADGQRPRSAALAQHPDDPLVQVDVAEGHADALATAHAGGFMPFIGLAWRSPSASAHLRKACRPR
jgi:hypothetical protein